MSHNKATQTYICLSKIRYTDWKEITQLANHLKVKWDCPTVSAYKCPICGGFHITGKKSNYNPENDSSLVEVSSNKYAPKVRNKEEADYWIQKKGWNKPPKRVQEHIKAVKRSIRASKRFK